LVFVQNRHDVALKLRLNRKMYQVMSNVANLKSLSSSFWGKAVNSKKGLRKKACSWFLFTGRSGVFSAFGKNSTCAQKDKGSMHFKCSGNWKIQESGKLYKSGKYFYCFGSEADTEV